MEDVSIIVPVYNTKMYLKQCIESILAQSFKNYKLILIDDGSIDGSGQICDHYKQQDERVVVYHQINAGIGAARNKGLELAKGKYILFIDSDDWIEPNLLEEVYKNAEAYGVDMVLWGYKAIIFDFRERFIKKIDIRPEEHIWDNKKLCEEHLLDIIKWNELLFDLPWNKLYKRKIIEEHYLRFIKVKRREDAIFNVDYYKHIKSLSTMPKSYSNYRIIDKGYAFKASPDYIEVTLDLHRKYKALLNSWKRYKGEEKQYIEYNFICDVIHIMGYCMYTEWHLGFKEKYQYVSRILCNHEVQESATVIDLSRKKKGMRAFIDRKRIRWIRKKRVLTMLLSIYSETFYQKVMYKKRIKKAVPVEP